MGSTADDETQWQRVHRFRKWNQHGPPGGLTRFAYAHPTAVGLMLLGGVLGGLGALFATQGLGSSSVLFGGFTLLFSAAAALQLRSGRHHLQDWEAADEEERHRVADQDHAMLSPIAKRLLAGYGIVGGLVLTVLLVAMVVTASS